MQVEEKISKRNWLIIIVLISGTFLGLISETVMNIAIPNIMADFNVSTSTAQWLTTGYMLVIGVSIPLSAYLMERFTLRQLFFSALIFYAAGSFLGFIATEYFVLFTGRMIQALGTGIVMPLTMNVILILTPVRKIGTMMGIYTLVILFAPAIGPVFSGIVIEFSSWRTIFLIIMVMAVTIMIASLFSLRNITEQKNTRVDLLSVLLSTLGFGGLVYGFSSAGESAGWSNPAVWVALSIGLISLITFIRRQTVLDSPMLSMRPFKSSVFSRAMILMLLLMMLQFSMMLILPLYFQNVTGLSPLETGILMLPGGIVLALTSLIAGRLFDKIGFKPLLITGIVIITFTLNFFTSLSSETSLTAGMLMYAAFTFGLGFTLPAVQTLALNQVIKPLHAHGSAISNTVNQISGAIGPALYTSVMTIASQRFISTSPIADENKLLSEGMTAGVHTVYYIAIGVAIISLVISLTFKKKDQYISHGDEDKI